MRNFRKKLFSFQLRVYIQTNLRKVLTIFRERKKVTRAVKYYVENYPPSIYRVHIYRNVI